MNSFDICTFFFPFILSMAMSIFGLKNSKLSSLFALSICCSISIYIYIYVYRISKNNYNNLSATLSFMYFTIFCLKIVKYMKLKVANKLLYFFHLFYIIIIILYYLFVNFIKIPFCFCADLFSCYFLLTQFPLSISRNLILSVSLGLRKIQLFDLA